MENKEPGYFAIIPAEVRYDINLTPGAKLLYGEITALCNKEGYCWATNEYFSKLYMTSEMTISRWINSLKEQGYITTEIKTFRYQDGTVKTIRYMCINKNASNHLDKNVSDHLNKNVEHNNTISNNTISNINDTTKVVSLEQAPKTYGNEEINEMFDEWEKRFGYKPKNSVNNRRAIYNMLRAKDKGKVWLIETMMILAEAQKDKYAGKEVLGVADFADLQYNRDKIWKWGSNKMKRNIMNDDEFDLAKI